MPGLHLPLKDTHESQVKGKGFFSNIWIRWFAEVERLLTEGEIAGTAWDDISVDMTPTRRGANNKPDYDYTNLGLLFPQNDVSEKVYFTKQMKHRKKLGSSIGFHVHYIQSTAGQPTYVAQYKFYNNNAAPSAGWTTVTTADAGGSKGAFTYTSGSLLQIAKFPAIAAPANEGLSANFDCIMWRLNDSTPAADVLTKYVDIHIEMDSLGSTLEYTK